MKRMFACFFVMAVLPLVTSQTRNSPRDSGPFATIAYAGHTLSGGEWCQCGAPGCLCDPGESPGGGRATPANDGKSSDQALSPIHARSQSGSDLGTGTLLLALAIFLWARLRA
jgi:hypothetical protein